jgi:hypothetical protein
MVARHDVVHASPWLVHAESHDYMFQYELSCHVHDSDVVHINVFDPAKMVEKVGTTQVHKGSYRRNLHNGEITKIT